MIDRLAMAVFLMMVTCGLGFGLLVVSIKKRDFSLMPCAILLATAFISFVVGGLPSQFSLGCQLAILQASLAVVGVSWFCSVVLVRELYHEWPLVFGGVVGATSHVLHVMFYISST